MATPKAPFEINFSPTQFNTSIFKLDHSFDLVTQLPPGTKQLRLDSPGAHSRAGYTRMTLNVDALDDLISDSAENLPRSGSTQFDFYYKSIKINFHLNNIEVYISSDYDEKSCPYEATYNHEIEAHVIASLRIFNNYKDQLITALNGIASILPTKAKPKIISNDMIDRTKSVLEKVVFNTVKEEKSKLARLLREESLRQDSDYTHVYKQCPAADWKTSP